MSLQSAPYETQVVGTVTASLELRAIRGHESSDPVAQISRSVSQAYAADFWPSQHTSAWSGQFTVPAASSKKWYLQNAVAANREVNSLAFGCDVDRVFMLYIKNKGTEEIILESDSGGLGDEWPELLSDGSELHLVEGACLLLFCPPPTSSPWGWHVNGDTALVFRNDNVGTDIDVECAIIGADTP